VGTRNDHGVQGGIVRKKSLDLAMLDDEGDLDGFPFRWRKAAGSRGLAAPWQPKPKMVILNTITSGNRKHRTVWRGVLYQRRLSIIPELSLRIETLNLSPRLKT
jgi:hypothetical protein